MARRGEKNETQFKEIFQIPKNEWLRARDTSDDDDDESSWQYRNHSIEATGGWGGALKL